ncbi:MAG: hypothetical protein ACD_43C00095G0002 [uncultured bacterium]|nr:MAG: hypothetical protein ACD_43C00095G0002 [uncultured bacterium]
MEQTTQQNPTVAQSNPTPSLVSSSAVTTPEKKSKTGCYIIGVLGCLWLFIVVALAATGIGYYFYQQYQDDLYWNDYYNSVIYNDNYNYNYNYNDNINIEPDTNTNETFDNTTVSDSGEIIGDDGVSLGFAADPIDPDLYAYQAGAYANQHFSDTKWSAVRITLDYSKVAPMADDNDSGSLWVGVTLDNDYFIQIGMNSSTKTDSNGNMRWNYFWQMWDDKDNYKYGLQEPLENYDWHENASNTFTLTCQDPDTGEWEFWVNGTVMGKTNTGSCAMDVNNSHIFWELTTDKTEQAELPTFGPFTISNYEYWDGYDWQPVTSAITSYGYGKVIDGTESNQTAVCPPYGIEAGPKKTLILGSTVSCLPDNQEIWN